MKKFLSLMLTICLVVSVITIMPITANAASKTYYGYIDAYDIAENNFGKVNVDVRFYDSEGAEYIYSIDSITLNGVEYSDANNNFIDLIGIFPTGVFGMYTLSSNNKITDIIFDDTAKSYTDVTYNPSTKKFDGVDTNTASLPVYYKYNDEFITPTLDANHKYNIEVYDYAVYINSFSALNEGAIINDITISCDITSELYQDMDILCTSTTQDAVLVVQLHSTTKPEDLTEVKSKYNNGYYATITKLPNDDVEYTVNLHLEDNNGTIISPIYTRTFKTTHYPVSYGYIKEVYSDEDNFGKIFLSVCFSDNEGNEYIEYSTENLTLNGEPYDFEKEIPQNVFADYILVNDQIAVLNFDTTPKLYTNVTYAADTTSNASGAYFINENTKISLEDVPVYYKYNDEFVTPILDEKHKYTIEVYDYAIYITSMSAINATDVINNINIVDTINSDFTRTVNIYCNATNNNSILSCEIYDTNSKLVSAQKAEYTTEYIISLNNLSGKYTAKLWLEDKDGNIISPIYDKQFETKGISVSNGYIMDFAIEADSFINLTFQIKINDCKGKTPIYETQNILVNGIRYSNSDLEDLFDIIPYGAFAEFVITEEEIVALNFDSNSIGISNFEYKPSADDLIVNLDVVNNFDNDKNSSVLIATFKSGKLEQLLCIPISIKAGSSQNVYKKLPNKNKADCIKVFIWDSTDNIAPYNPKITSNIAYE